jgi:alpha-D-ribose 1-methylphosphonate 5-triphosphate synthase subunit PhnI
MGYVAVKGGTKAIEESIKRLTYERLKFEKILDVEDIEAGLRSLIDQMMSESSLYCTKMSSIAIKQAEGSPEEAVFLLRAYRSTLPRNHYSKVIDTRSMTIERRISAAFKDIPGGQILGPCLDYTHRLIDFDIIDEKVDNIIDWVRSYKEDFSRNDIDESSPLLINVPRVSDLLMQQGLIKMYDDNNTEPSDVTKESVQFPANRSQRLQMLTRGQTGGVMTFGYAAIRGYGAYHPTVAELRMGFLSVYVGNPMEDGCTEDEYYVGEIKVTEVETLFPVQTKRSDGMKEMTFETGYGICFGQNESKAIAMSILDHCLETGNKEYPTHNEEFVLMHIDAVEASGFISHLKLPHYVTFQSELDSARKTKSDCSTHE